MKTQVDLVFLYGTNKSSFLYCVLKHSDDTCFHGNHSLVRGGDETNVFVAEGAGENRKDVR